MESEKPKQWHPGCPNSQSAALLSPLVSVCVSGQWEWANGGRRGLCHCRPWGPGLLWLEPGWVVPHWGRPFWGGMDLLIWFSIFSDFSDVSLSHLGCSCSANGSASPVQCPNRGRGHHSAPFFGQDGKNVHSKFWHWSSLVRDFWHS